jgi:predicted transcriptional regulator
MKTFCEVVALEFLPAVKALIARDLAKTYGMTQRQIADRMEITQPSVSYYSRELRGVRVKVLESNERLMSFVSAISRDIAEGRPRPVDIHDLCMLLVSENLIKEQGLQKCSACRE